MGNKVTKIEIPARGEPEPTPEETPEPTPKPTSEPTIEPEKVKVDCVGDYDKSTCTWQNTVEPQNGGAQCRMENGQVDNSDFAAWYNKLWGHEKTHCQKVRNVGNELGNGEIDGVHNGWKEKGLPIGGGPDPEILAAFNLKYPQGDCDRHIIPMEELLARPKGWTNPCKNRK